MFFHQMAPTLELVDISQNIRRRVSKLEKKIVENERKSSDVLQEIDQLVNVQNLIHACLGGDDVPIWAELDRVRHILNKGGHNGEKTKNPKADANRKP